MRVRKAVRRKRRVGHERSERECRTRTRRERRALRLAYLQGKPVPMASPWRGQATKDWAHDNAPRMVCLCSLPFLQGTRGVCANRDPLTGCDTIPF